MKNSKLIAILLATAMLNGCSQGAPGAGIMNGGGLNKEDVGTAAGAIGGGVLGSTMGRGAGKVATTIGGALIGGIVGNQIGKSLDNADRAAFAATQQKALETAQPGQALPWSNPQNGNSGNITPSNYYQNPQGQYCREFTQTIIVGGQKEDGYGKACRQPDGTWKIVQ